MPRGHSFSIYAPFSGKKRTSMHISREKCDYLILLPNTAQRSFFSHLNLFVRNLKKKIGPKSARKY